jgi:hypothetical protein
MGVWGIIQKFSNDFGLALDGLEVVYLEYAMFQNGYILTACQVSCLLIYQFKEVHGSEQ